MTYLFGVSSVMPYRVLYVIGFFVAYGAGYLISLAFPKPDPAKFEGTLFQSLHGYALPKAPQTNWRPYYVTLALYGTGILALLVVMTYG